jgi:hypothetical protein
MDNIIEVEAEMRILGKKVVTSSPAKTSFNSAQDESGVNFELTPVKADKDLSLSLRYVFC